MSVLSLHFINLELLTPEPPLLPAKSPTLPNFLSEIN